LINRCMTKDLPTHLHAANRELRKENGQLICKYTQLPLKDVCKKYLRNRHLVKKLLAEKKQRPNKEPKRSYSSIQDGHVFERLRGKLKLEIYIDDANLAPACG